MYRIAIIDDHHILLDGLKWVISQYEFVKEVTAWTSAEGFVEALNHGLAVEAVVTDLQMPEFNGHDLIDYLNTHYPKVKILVMTMFDSPYVMRKVMQTKATGFFIKQGDQSELEKALKAVLEGGEYWPPEMAALQAENQTEYGSLTRREAEILRLIAAEHTTKRIAESLFISEDTVLTHRKNIMSKLDVHSTAGLVAFALKNNLT
jgi:DNA-binding NarL/FixJ family response regulator